MKKKESIIELMYNDFNEWERYKLVDRVKARKKKLVLNWLGGSGATPRSVEGSFEGSIVDDGNGYEVELDGGVSLQLDYSQAHILLMLLQLVDGEPKTVKQFMLEGKKC